ncbi:MAG: hypothetical protein JNK15_09815 [Planctomycetes bacterium]|nr:hypothetical protein [Planctomycetota bacterium]
MPSLPRTLVVVSHYDARPRQDLDTLLDDLARVPAGAPFDVLVVVNQTRPEPTAISAALPGLRVLHRPNSGYNIGAWEHGWRSASGYAHYLFLQDECRLRRPGWLLPFVLRLQRPEVGLVGERMNPTWAADWATLERRFAGHTLDHHHVDGEPAERLPTYRAFWQRNGIDPGPRGDHLQTLVLAVRADVLQRIGGFPLGSDYGEAIAAEIGVSKRVQMLGLSVEEVGPRPFTWITHPQWQEKADRQPLRAPRLGLAAWLERIRGKLELADLPRLELHTGTLFPTAADERGGPATIVHTRDVDAVGACRDDLLAHCRWLLLPRIPDHGGAPGERLLEDWFPEVPELFELEVQGRLVWYADSPEHARRFPGGTVAADASATLATVLQNLGVRTPPTSGGQPPTKGRLRAFLGRLLRRGG